MASSGPNSPGTLADDSGVGTLAWTNPNNASSSDNTYATVLINNPTVTTHYLKATNFGFSIPNGSTINGIVVEIERKSSSNTVSRFARDNVVKLVIGGSIVGSNYSLAAKWSTTESYFTYGGSSDLWGNTITVSDVNSSTFGVVLSASLSDTNKVRTETAYVDHIRITVYYTENSAVPRSSAIFIG